MSNFTTCVHQLLQLLITLWCLASAQAQTPQAAQLQSPHSPQLTTPQQGGPQGLGLPSPLIKPGQPMLNSPQLSPGLHHPGFHNGQIFKGGASDPGGGGHLTGQDGDEIEDMLIAEEHELQQSSNLNLLVEPSYREVAFPKLKSFEEKLPFTGRELRNATFKKLWYITKRPIDCPFISTTQAARRIPFACQTTAEIRFSEEVFRHPRVSDQTRGYMIVHEIVRAWTSTMSNNALHADDVIRLITRTIMGNQNDQSISEMIQVLQAIRGSDGRPARLEMGWALGQDFNQFRNAPVDYSFNEYVWKKVNPLVVDLYNGYCGHANDAILAMLVYLGQFLQYSPDVFSQPAPQIRYKIYQNSLGFKITDWRHFSSEMGWTPYNEIDESFNEYDHINMSLLALTAQYPHQSLQTFQEKSQILRRRGIEILDDRPLFSKNMIFFRFKLPEALDRQIEVIQPHSLTLEAMRVAQRERISTTTPSARVSVRFTEDLLNLVPELKQFKNDFNLEHVEVMRQWNGIYRIIYGGKPGQCDKGELDRSHLILKKLGIIRAAASNYCDSSVTSYNFLFTADMSVFGLRENLDRSNAIILKRLFQTDGRRLLPKQEICAEIAPYIQKIQNENIFDRDPHHIRQWLKLER